MFDALHYEFMQNALFAGLLASVACGIIGTLIVVNRIVFISGGIAHAAYGGIGLAFFIGFSPLLGAVGFALAVAFIIAFISLKNKQRADTVIGALWAMGMGFGVILIDLTPGYNVDLMSYLFGSILTVPRSDLWLMIPLDVAILVIVTFFYKDFLAMSYDDEYAGLMGVPVKTLYFVLLALVACSVVVIIRVIGLILVIALLSIPPYIAEQFSRSLQGMMLISTLLNMVFTIIGLWLSYTFNITSGATIIMVAGTCFFLSTLLRSLRRKRIPETLKSAD
ncbi:metal ABC transporter permease [Candidatus Sumerlaeota bacterium]|nr:metal ABC transporter permease [Candidatus Sumerlaeota bacterium]